MPFLIGVPASTYAVSHFYCTFILILKNFTFYTFLNILDGCFFFNIHLQLDVNMTYFITSNFHQKFLVKNICHINL